ncbi:MAG: GNAT family N-acetyltransferase [Erysipelotrichaceae bacterium]|nr:GNAT family N-acetyltransferase [Erysipelotrichaceae bacterium]
MLEVQKLLSRNTAVLSTERLLLRKMTAADAKPLDAVLGDPEVMKYYPAPFDQAKVRNWIAVNQERYRHFGFDLWSVVLKSAGQVIGDCGLTIQYINGILKPEIGCHIRKDCRKQGCGKEAACAVWDCFFENTPFQRVVSCMKSGNESSKAAARSMGMQLMKEYTDAEHKPVSVYGIASDEWTELKNSAMDHKPF